MTLSTAYDKAKGEEEHILYLPGGRQLAYAHNGPQTSRTIVIFFTGLMSVGSAPNVPAPCRELGVHWIAPTLPGMGNSSIRDLTEPYHVAFSRDMTALLRHLYPTSAFDAIYLAGGSYGSVQAQMLYGAPYEMFPHGRKIVGCILIAGFSPFKYDTGYAKTLNWQNWFSVGPLSQLPFHPLQRLFSTVVASKFKSLDGARDFLRQTLLSKMDEEGKSMFAQWLEKNGRTEFDFVDQMARGAIKCCQTWDGFMEVSDVIHSDWGFEPAMLDDEHATKPVLVVGSEKDHLGGSTNGWIVANYRSANLKLVPGGHIASLYYMDDIWREMIDRKSSSRCSQKMCRQN
jgi:Alpha/beta hydrolase family